jgi:hypothetical protein
MDVGRRYNYDSYVFVKPWIDNPFPKEKVIQVRMLLFE